jgi:hypothetical protein
MALTAHILLHNHNLNSSTSQRPTHHKLAYVTCSPSVTDIRVCGLHALLLLQSFAPVTYMAKYTVLIVSHCAAMH